MSKKILWIVIVLLTCMVGVTKWHHNTDRGEFGCQLDSDLYCMKVLAEQIDEQAQYIKKLEAFIMLNHQPSIEEPQEIK